MPISVRSLSEALISLGLHAEIIDWNDAAMTLLGWTKAEVLAKRLPSVLLEQTKSSDTRGSDALEQFLATPDGGLPAARLEIVGVDNKGNRMPLELMALESDYGCAAVKVIMVRDLTGRNKMQTAHRSLQRITQILADSGSLKEATPKLLEEICTTGSWGYWCRLGC